MITKNILRIMIRITRRNKKKDKRKTGLILF